MHLFELVIAMLLAIIALHFIARRLNLGQAMARFRQRRNSHRETMTDDEKTKPARPTTGVSRYIWLSGTGIIGALSMPVLAVALVNRIAFLVLLFLTGPYLVALILVEGRRYERIGLPHGQFNRELGIHLAVYVLALLATAALFLFPMLMWIAGGIV